MKEEVNEQTSNKNVIEKYYNQFKDYDTATQEGLILLVISLIIGIFIGFFSKYFPNEWIFLIFLDFIIYAFIYLNRYSKEFTEYFSIGKRSTFEKGSIFYRAGRLLLYLLVVRIFFQSNQIEFFHYFSVLVIASFWIYAFILEYSKYNPNSLMMWLDDHENLVSTILVVSCIGLLGLLLRLYKVYDMGTWDEGWYSSITSIMYQTQNWFEPLYYKDNSASYLLFDKPPLMFILGSIEIAFFGFTSFAGKFSMGFFSGLMGIAAFLIFSHLKEENKTEFVPNIERYEEEELEDEIPFKHENGQSQTPGKVVGIIFGLSMATAWFLIFYGRTAYLDAAIVAFTAFTALFAVKAIDHWFYGNKKRAYVYLILTALVNMINLLAKAWQGLIVGPPIAIYLFARYYEYLVPKNSLHRFLLIFKQNLRTTISNNYKFIIFISLFVLGIAEYSNTVIKEFIDLTRVAEYSNIVIEGFLELNIIFDISFVIILLFLYLGFLLVKDLLEEVKISNLFNNFSFVDVFSIISTFLFLINYSNFMSKKMLEIIIFDSSIDLWSIFLGIIIYILIRSILTSFLHSNENHKFLSFYHNIINEQNSRRKIESLLSLFVGFGLAIFIGFISAFIGAFGFEFIYDRFFAVFTEGGEKYLSVLNTIEQQQFAGELLLGVISLGFSGFISLFVLFFVFMIVFSLLDVYSFVTRKINFSSNFSALKISSEFSLLVPLAIFGFGIFYWVYFLLFKGDFFSRDLSWLFVSGVLLPIISLILALLYIDFLKFVWFSILKKEENSYLINWTTHMSKFLLFLTVMAILIVLSFFPFLSWIDYMDNNVVGSPLNIRVPGELFNDSRVFCASIEEFSDPLIDCKPNYQHLTYDWLFYEYYIGWRYGGYGKYSVIDSFSGVLGPLFLICLPFFIAGIIAFIKKRKYSALLFFISWFLIVLFTFLPASFQLNYYYLALLFPYFAISSFGMFWAFEKTKSGIHFKDYTEKLIIASPILLILAYSYIYIPHISGLQFIKNGGEFEKFIASSVIVIILFIVLLIVAVRSLPGAFSLAIVIFYLNKHFILHGYGNFDQDLLIISVILIALVVYQLKDSIPPSSAFFLFIIIFTAASTTAWWVNWKTESTTGLEEMGGFILDHGGSYNESSWIYDDSGARFAFRFYLGGLQTVNDNGSEHPFESNSTSVMEAYTDSRPDVKYFVVTNTSLREDMTPTSDYSVSYSWLKEHFVWVNPLLGIRENHGIHLFVHESVLTSAELALLNG